MKLCAKVKLKVDQGDEKRLFETMTAYKFAWQTVSDWSFNSGTVSQMDAHKATYYPVRAKFPDLPANLVQAARTDALAKIKSAKSNRHQLKSAPKLKTVTLRYDTRTSTTKGNVMSLAVCGGSRIKASFEDYPRLAELRGKYKMLSPGVFYKNGEFWAALIFEIPDVQPDQTGKLVGLDLGQRNVVATSEGRIYKGKALNRARRKTRFVKRKLQHQGTKASKRKLRALRLKERRQSRDAVHKLVKRVITDTQAAGFVVEKLKLPNAKGFGKTGKNRRKYAVPLGMFKELLKQKAARLGKRVVEVSPYMTSQEDCRGLKKGTRVGGRYIGIDGRILNADINAAINIVRKVETNPLVPKGYEWQAAVTRPIACKSFFGKSCNS